jgi:hypothetical protein
LKNLDKKQLKENEKKSLKLITKKFSQGKLKRRIKIENIKAQKYVLDRPIVKIRNFLKEAKKSTKPLLIIGSPDHNAVILKLFKKELHNHHFLSIKKNDVTKEKTSINNIKKQKKFNKFNLKNFYKKVFISSFEHYKEIISKFNLKNNYFSPYDNSSRSILDYYYIKRFSGRSKLHSKTLNLNS